MALRFYAKGLWCCLRYEIHDRSREDCLPLVGVFVFIPRVDAACVRENPGLSLSLLTPGNRIVSRFFQDPRNEFPELLRQDCL